MDRGLLAPYPGTDKPFSAEEVRQLLRRSAEDIDHSADLALTMNPLLAGAALRAARTSRCFFGSQPLPDRAGLGPVHRLRAPERRRTCSTSPTTTIPPEADLSGSLRWFDTVDPARTKKVEVTRLGGGGARARKASSGASRSAAASTRASSAC